MMQSSNRHALVVEKEDRIQLKAKLVVEVFPIFGSIPTDTVQVLPLFRPEDYRVLSKSSDTQWLRWWEDYEWLVRYPVFQITVSEAIDRLEFLGVSLDAARTAFQEERAIQCDQLRTSEWAHEGTNSPYAIMKNISMEAWQEHFLEMYNKGVWRVKDLRCMGKSKVELTQRFISDSVNPFGLPCPDQRTFLRIALDVMPDDHMLTLHCRIPWDKDGYELYKEIEHDLIGELGWFNKTIVLTEGKFDSEILSRALVILRPHLAPLFHFIRFDQFNVPGGAPHLVNTVKAFAASGVQNRVIALFDNDTAGHAGVHALRMHNALPPNFRVLTLPDIPLANSYRTLGPTGEAEVNVNGKAAAIELYFPRETLEGSDGKLTAVQWTGYDEKMKRYQGELLDKHGCQSRMLKLLDRLEREKDLLAKVDLSGFQLIFDSLVRAYHPSR